MGKEIHVLGINQGIQGCNDWERISPGHLVDIAENTKEGKAQLELRKQNKRGYSELLLSVSDEVTFGLIDGSRTTDLQEGCLMTTWNKLERKFVPKTNATMVKLVKEFGQMSLKDKKKALMNGLRN